MIAASASADQPGSTFPPPGSPEEATILAVVSSTITFSGSLAVSAIKAGATQLDSSAAKGKESEEEGGLNGFAIAGIVAGGVLGLFIIVLVWYKLVSPLSNHLSQIKSSGNIMGCLSVLKCDYVADKFRENDAR